MKLHEWLSESPFTLSMSSGFFSFFAHAGMLSALDELALVPVKVTGSSAGALVGGCYASGCSIEEVKQQLFSLQRSDFWDPGLGLGLLKGQLFRDQLAQFCKVDKVEDCRIPLRVSAYNLSTKQTDVLTEGSIGDAIAASCAFPVLFQPVHFSDSRYLDGGIQDRPGLYGTEPGERIFYHHISSKSPWRRKNSASLLVPQRENMQSIAIPDLPRVGPNKLSEGPVAYDYAYRQTQILLQQSI
ncbi:patatin [Gammaproteobacteria bacterium 45_16_T64]|nr:patatin [Gammaproteobacteria bacterium 45_16_T64]